jgi:tRNA(Ile)-lysidine synthase
MAHSRTPGPDPVESAITEFLADHSGIRSLRVAFSGGRDSTVLLHALARQPLDHALDVVHVHHGLHPEADAQSRHCREVAQRLGLHCEEHRIEVPPAPPEGMEASARRLRYEALMRGLPRDGCVLTAHHALDQAETFLLAALRGSGPSGLSGMPRVRPLGAGWLGRPLLGCSDAQVAAYATRHGLSWVEDPTNTDIRFDRNFLRREILPALSTRFPAELRLSAAADLQGAATRALNLLLDRQLQDLGGMDSDSRTLGVAALLEQPAELHSWLLRRFVQRAGFPAPRRGPLLEFLRQLRQGGDAAQPELHWARVSLRCHHRQIHIVESEPTEVRADGPLAIDWPATAAALDLPDGRRLTRDELEAAGVDPGQPVRIRFRSGGERVSTPSGRRSLKKMMQERGVPRWRRARLPLVQVGEELVAVLWDR